VQILICEFNIPKFHPEDPKTRPKFKLKTQTVERGLHIYSHQ
jgi:hypothetical protein